MSTIAIIIATDPGDDFPTSKYASVVGGRPMLRGAVESALAWGLDGVVVVLGPDDDANAMLIDDLDVTTVIDPEWAEGLASPLRVALDLVTRDRAVEYTVISMADQPDIPPDVVERLIAAARESQPDAVVPKYRYQRGWPAIVGSSMWRRLLGMEGDYDLHSLISMHASTIEEVWFDRLAPPTYRSVSDLPTH